MAISALRVGLFGVVAVVPAMVTAFAVSRPVASDCSVTLDSPRAAEAKATVATPTVEAKPAVVFPPRRPSTRATIAAHIADVATRYRLSEQLVAAVIAVESEFNPRAVSRRGARGLMQLMPGTAAMLGVRDPFDPRQNIDGGARYLKDLIERFDDDLPLALAAYNAGAPAVVAHGGVPPYPETREFVRRVLSRLGAAGDAVASAPEVRVASASVRTRVAMLHRPAKREAGAPVAVPAALAVSMNPREPLAVTADAPREPVERGARGRWATVLEALASAEAPPPRRDDSQSP